jgi:hypothetical protein
MKARTLFVIILLIVTIWLLVDKFIGLSTLTNTEYIVFIMLLISLCPVFSLYVLKLED